MPTTAPQAATTYEPPLASQPAAPLPDAGTFLVIPSQDEQLREAPELPPQRLHKPTLIAAAAVGIAWIVALLVIDQVIR